MAIVELDRTKKLYIFGPCKGEECVSNFEMIKIVFCTKMPVLCYESRPPTAAAVRL